MTEHAKISWFELPKFAFRWSSKAGPLLVIQYRNQTVGAFLFCHRDRERCIRIFGYTSFLCARCTGLCIGVAAFCFVWLMGLAIPPLFGLWLVLPMMIDGFSQLLKLRESNNILRLATGLFFSVGFLSLVVK